ncbi:hypothetical protein MUCCIDRAFT_157050 [Mucor lusitanicus CBS 277.49]|uniref:Uncharacterized protein n=1 Tax=Mucor lusitanicus CBS 277.49 TaxID=747725 RepID=A0A162YSV1_MUCCL|nr:hypothetical protein MUCCIDRAFT_157050 [Mucor lusitanicus CBS 277.49]
MTMVKAGIAMTLLHLLKQEAAEINHVIMMMTIIISNIHHHNNVHYLLYKNNIPTAQIDPDILKKIVAAIMTLQHLSKVKEVREAMAIDPTAMIKVHPHQQQQLTMITMIREECLHNPGIVLLVIRIMAPQK